METTDNTKYPWKFSTPEEKLRSYILAYRPIIYINGSDFREIDKLIGEQAKEAFGSNKKYEIHEFTFARGQEDWNGGSPRFKKLTENKIENRPYTLKEFLKKFDSAIYKYKESTHLLVLKEIHDKLTDTQVYSLLQSIAGRMRESVEDGDTNNHYHVQVLIVDSQALIVDGQERIPPGMEELMTIITLLPPRIDDIEKIVSEFRKSQSGEKHNVDEKFIKELAGKFAGLSKYAIEQILRLACENTDKFDNSIFKLIDEEKKQIIQKSGLVEFVDCNGISEVGGYNSLKRYVDDTCSIFNNPVQAAKSGVATPKGIMIVGMPGCGKTLMARTIGQKFKVPLIKLDIGRLMGKYVGECENNLRRAIATAESASPCVLWIDEIEKAFSGIGDEGGGGSAMTRMFGIFLTWMQDKKSRVYVVATSNNIDKLPPEFLRRGRFDEIFFVGFPPVEECKKILRLHMKRKLGFDDTGLDKLITKKVVNSLKGQNYSGADIESIVNEVMKSAFLNNNNGTGSTTSNITESDIFRAIQGMKSSYSSQKEKLDEMMKRLEKLGVRSA